MKPLYTDAIRAGSKPSAARVWQFVVDVGCYPDGLPPIVLPVKVLRTYAGRHQRAAGAWSWWMDDSTGVSICGSSWTLRDVLRAIREDRLGVLIGWGLGADLIVERKPYLPNENKVAVRIS